MLNSLVKTCVMATIAAILCSGLYGLAKVGKIVSYKWWYQDMVQQTVRKMVKDSALK